jgi:hypothetical protein
MKTITQYLLPLIISFVAANTFAQGNKIQQAMTALPEACQPLKATLDAAMVAPGEPGDKLKPAEIPKVVAALKNHPVTTPEQSAEVEARAVTAKNFSDLQSGFNELLAGQCMSQRFSMARALVNNVKDAKLTAAQKQEIADVLRTQWKSELNTSSVGLTINSNLMLTACENKSDKIFNIECNGLKEFRTKLREGTRASQKKSHQVMQTFTFFGRIRFYWDKWVMKKEMGRNINGETMDRYYDVAPIREILKQEYAEAKILRAEFEKFVK